MDTVVFKFTQLSNNEKENVVSIVPVDESIKKYKILPNGDYVDLDNKPIETIKKVKPRGLHELILLAELAYVGASELKGKDSIKLMRYIEELEERIESEDISDLTISKDQLKRFEKAYGLVKQIPREWIKNCRNIIYFIHGGLDE